jgi:hypothetical protein
MLNYVLYLFHSLFLQISLYQFINQANLYIRKNLRNLYTKQMKNHRSKLNM